MPRRQGTHEADPRSSAVGRQETGYRRPLLPRAWSTADLAHQAPAEGRGVRCRRWCGNRRRRGGGLWCWCRRVFGRVRDGSTLHRSRFRHDLSYHFRLTDPIHESQLLVRVPEVSCRSSAGTIPRRDDSRGRGMRRSSAGSDPPRRIDSRSRGRCRRRRRSRGRRSGRRRWSGCRRRRRELHGRLLCALLPPGHCCRVALRCVPVNAVGGKQG